MIKLGSMSQARTAKEIMTKNPRTIQSGAELHETISFFLESDVRTAPVVTPMGEVLGMMTDMGLVKASLKKYLDPERHEKVAAHKEILDEPTFVEEDAPVEEVIRAMIKSPLHRILVVSKQKRLLGIISPKDVVRFITGEQAKTVNLRAELEATRSEAQNLAKQLEGALHTLEKFQRLFVETPYMMHSSDENGKIIMANKKIHQVLGYEEGELIGRTIFDIYPKSVHHEARAGIDRIKEKGFHHTTYTTMLRKNGDKIRIDIASSSLKDKYGKFIGTISISREVDAEALLRALNGIMDSDEILQKVSNG